MQIYGPLSWLEVRLKPALLRAQLIQVDFNFDPSDPAYSLIRGDPLLTTQEDKITPSMVVHSSIDPSILRPSVTAKSKGDDEEDVDPDRHITNARTSTPQDGLLSVAEIVDWFSQLPKFRSMYDDGLAQFRQNNVDMPTYGRRGSVQAERHGKYEPEYTSFTHYWQSVLGKSIIQLHSRFVLLNWYRLYFCSRDARSCCQCYRVTGTTQR